MDRLEIKRMSTIERLQVMEALWDSFMEEDSKVEPKQRAHSPLLLAGLASELKTDTIPYGRRFPAACSGESSPEWHRDILEERKRKIENGKAEFISLKELRASRKS